MKRNMLKKRTLRLEQLENRELLSATTWNDAAQADAALAAEMVATLNENAPIDLTAAFSAAEVETTAEEAQTWFVTSNLDDGGEGTLRKIIEKAQAGDTIKFDPSLKGATITLTQGEIAIDKDLTIDAYDLYRFEDLEGLIHDQDHTGLTIDANFVDRVFNIAELTDEELENAPDQKVELKIIGVHMTNGSLQNNDDNYVHGGAIHVPAHGALTLEMCVISNSTAIEGGGAIVVSGELRAYDTIFENNNGGEDHGGAIRVFDGFVEVISCYFRGNTIKMAGSDGYSGGGGAVSSDGGVFRSFNTLYSGNSAAYGGAFFVAGGSVYLSNSLVVENGAVYENDKCSDGGGPNVDSGSLTVVNSTIAGNKITGNNWGFKRGAGLFANSNAGTLNVYIYNSIIAENVGDVDIELGGSRASVYGWNNLSSFTSWKSSSSGNITYDSSQPLFTETNGVKYALAEGSPAIDAGNVEYAKDYYGRTIEADFIRYNRVAGARIDIGALEYASTPRYEAIARPENVRFSDYNLAEKTVVVSWDDKSYNELGFRVEISTDGENWSWVAQTAENVSSTTLANIEPNTTYHVRVRAEVELSNVSEWSDVADVTAVVYTLDEPAVSAEATSATEIAFSIGEVENAVGYVYEYSANPDFSNATRGELATSGMLTISGLQPYTRYYFRAYAVGTGLYLDSPWNSTYATTEKAVLVAPTPGVALTDEETTLELSFDAVPNAKSYVYRYSTNPDFSNATEVNVAEAGVFDISGLTPGETYYFQTKAIGGGAYLDSEWSPTVAATTEGVDLPAPPVSVETIGTTTLDFAVGAVPNATSYVYRFAASEAELENATPVALDAAGIV
ncbi:MAG: fibronectin type III domain-containing protein, partial [Thermoguttaceae bacterium]|nr:fibronectin type III domain-containing protein [Thermoguttaceae bacterium]